MILQDLPGAKEYCCSTWYVEENRILNELKIWIGILYEPKKWSWILNEPKKISGILNEPLKRTEILIELFAVARRPTPQYSNCAPVIPPLAPANHMIIFKWNNRYSTTFKMSYRVCLCSLSFFVSVSVLSSIWIRHIIFRALKTLFLGHLFYGWIHVQRTAKTQFSGCPSLKYWCCSTISLLWPHPRSNFSIDMNNEYQKSCSCVETNTTWTVNYLGVPELWLTFQYFLHNFITRGASIPEPPGTRSSLIQKSLRPVLMEAKNLLLKVDPQFCFLRCPDPIRMQENDVSIIVTVIKLRWTFM